MQHPFNYTVYTIIFAFTLGNICFSFAITGSVMTDPVFAKEKHIFPPIKIT